MVSPARAHSIQAIIHWPSVSLGHLQHFALGPGPEGGTRGQVPVLQRRVWASTGGAGQGARVPNDGGPPWASGRCGGHRDVTSRRWTTGGTFVRYLRYLHVCHFSTGWPGTDWRGKAPHLIHPSQCSASLPPGQPSPVHNQPFPHEATSDLTARPPNQVRSVPGCSIALAPVP